MRSSTAIGASVVVICLGLAGLPGTVRVPEDQPTIQQGVDAAVEGDVVSVRAGRYAEHVFLNKRDGLVIKGRGNVVIDAGGSSFAMKLNKCDAVHLKHLRFENAGTHGLHLYNCSDPVISDCIVSNAAQDGIRLEYTLGTRLIGNRVEHVGGTGILDSIGGFAPVAADDVIASNEVSDCGAAGISLTGAVNHLIRNNRVERVGTTGIAVDSTTVVVRANSVKRAAGDGIRATGLGHTLVKNEVKRVGADGIWIDAGNSHCEKNRISRAADDGVDVSGKNDQFSKNVVKKSGDNGFEVNAAPNEVVDNRATGSTSFDLLDASAGQNVYAGNVFPKVGP